LRQGPPQQGEHAHLSSALACLNGPGSARADGDFIMRAAIAALAAETLVFCVPEAHAASRLAPSEIQATFFTGQPFTAATPANVKFKMLFTPDGKVTREPVGNAGGKGEGNWKLSKDGFCTTWKGGRPNCFAVLPSGDNKWSILKGTSVVATWTKSSSAP
jgi:hypothetical protein